MNPARILVVEDDPDMLETLTDVLRKSGHDLQNARSGLQACEVMKTQSLDLVITDIRAVTERAVFAMRESLITAEDLGFQPTAAAPPSQALGSYHYCREQVLDTLEMQYIEAALRAHHGNVSQTSDAVQIHRTSLQRLLRRHGLRSEDFRRSAGEPCLPPMHPGVVPLSRPP